MVATGEWNSIDLQKIERGHPGRRSMRRWRSRAGNWKSMMDIPQRPCNILMYSTRRIDWAYQRVNQSWSAKLRNRSDLEEQEEEEQEEQWIESQWWTYPSVLAPAQCTRPAESTEPASESIGVDLHKIEGGQPCRRRRRKRRTRSRAANWESIMDVPQHPYKVLMYSTRGI